MDGGFWAAFIIWFTLAVVINVAWIAAHVRETRRKS